MPRATPPRRRFRHLLPPALMRLERYATPLSMMRYSVMRARVALR